MIKPLPLYIGLRYTRAKRRNRFISFISFASMLGIALGVMVLITVLSVMNGFDQQIRSHFFAITPHVTITTQQNMSDGGRSLAHTVNPLPHVRGSAPFVSGEGMLISDGILQGVSVMGIIPAEESRISQLPSDVVEGSLNSLTPDSFHLVIGKAMADQFNLQVGDAINLYTSQAITTPLGLFPRYRRFTVSGIFSNSGSGLEQNTVFIAMDDAQKLFAAGWRSSGLHIKLANMYQAAQVSKQLQSLLPSDYTVSNWTVESGAFFQALAMEKTMMFIILLLIVAIAVFNLVSSLMMVVNEKQADIAILRTLGATPTTIMNIFIVQGTVIGAIGTLLGLISGILLAINVNAVATSLERWFHVQFIPASAYFVDYLPSKLVAGDIIEVCVLAFAFSLLATIYPARVAFRTQPAEALRYE